MGSVVIRKAVKEDCPRLVELVHELAMFERASHEVSMTLEDFTECGFGANPVWWAYVAEVDGNVEGFALYYIRYSTWKGQRMYLEDILVTEPFRRQARRFPVVRWEWWSGRRNGRCHGRNARQDRRPRGWWLP